MADVDRDVLDQDLGACILTVYSEDGFLGIGVDVPGQEQAGTSTFDARFPYGTFSRPRDPDVSTDQTRRIGATTLYAYAGTSRHAWPLDDPRVTPKLPRAPKGTWGAYADTGRDELPVMVLDGATGSYALRVPHSTGGGVASRVLVDVETPGAEEIVLAHGAGVTATVTIGPTGTDVTGLSDVTDPVALYTNLQAALSALTFWLMAAQVILVKIPVPPTVGELNALTAAYLSLIQPPPASGLLQIATNAALSSSAILRASTT